MIPKYEAIAADIRRSTEEEAERLDTKPGSPLLELNQIGFLDSGAAFEYSVSRNVGDRFELHNVTLA